jgi:DNA-binding phage protein
MKKTTSTLKKSAEIQKEIGLKLNQKLFDKRMSVTTLARTSGVNRTVLYRIFDGKPCNTASLIAVCVALELTLDINNFKF